MLKTERLVLRKWRESDAESLFEYAKNPHIGPIAGWPPHKSVEESLNVIKTVFNGAHITMATKSRNEYRKRLDLFIIIHAKMFQCHCSMKREWDIQI